MSDVHTTHCCPLFGCKYGDEDCTVATGQAEAEYECEDCCCERFHPNLLKEANGWWKSLTDEEKRSVYHFSGLRGEKL